MKRVQVYVMDMGLFRKQYITHMEADEIEAYNRDPRSLTKAIVLDESDPCGEKLPNTYRNM